MPIIYLICLPVFSDKVVTFKAQAAFKFGVSSALGTVRHIVIVYIKPASKFFSREQVLWFRGQACHNLLPIDQLTNLNQSK